MDRRFLFFKKDSDINPYLDAFAVYSLRNLYNWTDAVLWLRRSSDNQLRYVFFDGDGITLNSKVGGSFHSPGSQTLGDWVGSDDSHVRGWIKQVNGGSYDGNDFLIQSNDLKQPKFISNGIILTKNGKSTIEFDGVDDYMLKASGAFNELDEQNNFTAFSVAYNTKPNSGGRVFNTRINTGGSASRIFLEISREASKILYFVKTNTNINYFAYRLTQNDISSQQLLTLTKSGKTMSGYYNDDFQDTFTYTDTYDNTNFAIARNFSGSGFLEGGIQELILFPSDKTLDLNVIHTDINNYYNIY